MLILSWSLAAHAADRLASIDLAAKLITVDTSAGLKSYRIKDFTEVTINGQRSTAEQLKPGMKVAVTISDLQTASRIAAAVEGAVAPTPGISPPGGLANTGVQQHQLRIKMRVEANEIVKVKGGSVWIEHQRFDFPTDISINGIHWDPQWTGNRSDDFTKFTPPLAPFTNAAVKVKKIHGRDSVEVQEPPTEQNGQTLTLHFMDKPVGGDVYEIHVDW